MSLLYKQLIEKIKHTKKYVMSKVINPAQNKRPKSFVLK